MSADERRFGDESRRWEPSSTHLRFSVFIRGKRCRARPTLTNHRDAAPLEPCAPCVSADNDYGWNYTSSRWGASDSPGAGPALTGQQKSLGGLFTLHAAADPARSAASGGGPFATDGRGAPLEPCAACVPAEDLLWRQPHPYTWGSKLPLARLEHMCYIPGRGGRLSEMSCPPPSIKGWGFDERRHTRW
jgi:hypothetical protein